MKQLILPSLRSADDALTRFLSSEYHRLILWTPVFLGFGVLLFFALPYDPPLTTAVTGIVSMLVCTRLMWQSNWWAGRYLILALLLVAIGFLSAYVRTERVKAPILEEPLPPRHLVGQIEEIQPMPGKVPGRVKRVILSDIRLENLEPSETPAKVRLHSYHFQNNNSGPFEPGDWIKTRAVLKPPPPPVAPDAFDFQRYAFYQQLGAIGFTIEPAKILSRPDDPGLLHAIEGLRQHIADTAIASLPQDQGPVAAALMTGKRTAIDDETLQAFRDAGLAHLLSISGLHVGLIAGLIFVGIRLIGAAIPRIALRWPTKKIAAVGGILMALFYLLMAGAPVPTQRAFIMTTIVFLGVLLDRRGISMRLVVVAATAILLLTPEMILNPGFQMSFAAVIGLIAFYESLRDRTIHQEKIRTWWLSALRYVVLIMATTLIAELATTGFSLHHFNRLTLYNIVANMVAMPIMVFWVMPMVVVSYLGFMIGLPEWPLWLTGIGIDVIVETGRTVVAWPGAVILLPTLPTYGLLAIVIGGLWLALWRERHRWMGVPFMILGFLSILVHDLPDLKVDQSGRLVGIRTLDQTLYLTTTRAEKFAATLWREAYGLEDALAMGDAPVIENESENLACGPEGCLYTRGDITIAIAQSRRALQEDCGIATLIITDENAPENCQAPHIIDRDFLDRFGASAVWFDKGGIRLETVRDVRGHRIWMP